MRILLAGSYSFDWYEKACADALESLGHQVIRFSWGEYFTKMPGKLEVYAGLSGPNSWQANKKLIQTVKEHDIDLLFLWRATHVTPQILRLLRQKHPKCLLVSYNNDDPFSPKYTSPNSPFSQRRLWKVFRSAIPEYDFNFVYRPINLAEYRAECAKKVSVLMPYFLPNLHFPQQLTTEEKQLYECDVVFIGHYEPDGRDIYLKALVDAGLRLRIFGNGWPTEIADSISPSLEMIIPVLGDQYSKALCGAKVCLSFLSKLNRDTYTRRNIEIPACGCVMLSERTADLNSLFQEGKEAMYFDSQEEIVERAFFLVNNHSYRESMAMAALDRAWKDGHDVNSRMDQMIEILSGATIINYLEKV